MTDAHNAPGREGPGPQGPPDQPAYNPYAPQSPQPDQPAWRGAYPPGGQGPQPPAGQGPQPSAGQGPGPYAPPGPHPGPVPGYGAPPPGYPLEPQHPAGTPAPGYAQPPGYAPMPAWQPPRPYHHALHRPQGGNIWRGIVAIVLLVVGFFALQIPASILLISESDSIDDLSLTPLGLASLNLSLAALWPLSLGIQRLLYGVRPGTLHAVSGRIRWRLFGILASVLVPLYLLYVLASAFFLPEEETSAFTATALAFILVAILTTPLQAAGEEAAFRGLLHRAVGGWFRNPRIALVVGAIISSIVFAIAHGATDLWLNAFYGVFGLSMVVITWRTQGLEGAIIAHAAYNTFLMVFNAVMGGDFDGIFEREAGAGGPFVLVPMGVSILAAALVWWRTRTDNAREAMHLPENIEPNHWREQDAPRLAPTQHV